MLPEWLTLAAVLDLRGVPADRRHAERLALRRAIVAGALVSRTARPQRRGRPPVEVRTADWLAWAGLTAADLLPAKAA